MKNLVLAFISSFFLFSIQAQTFEKIKDNSITRIGTGIEYEGKLYYNKIEYTYNNNNAQLWTSDGTTDGTFLIKKINPINTSSPSEFTIYKGMLFFSADNGTNGRELWITDGTTNGTQWKRTMEIGWDY